MIVTCALPRSSDQELMLRVQADDDRDAFGELYARFSPRAMRLAWGMCRDDDRARDAVQDGFLSLWRTRAQYRPALGDVDAWAFTIIRNRAMDCHRRARRHESRLWRGEDVIEHMIAPGDIQHDVIADDDAQRLRTLLAELPAAQREVIALAYFGELTHTEIAARLTLPLGTVKGRMRLGMNRLRCEAEDNDRLAGSPVSVAAAAAR
jgi:RNA polymerase sigma-70 factor (ECF subfamily)